MRHFILKCFISIFLGGFLLYGTALGQEEKEETGPGTAPLQNAVAVLGAAAILTIICYPSRKGVYEHKPEF